MITAYQTYRLCRGRWRLLFAPTVRSLLREGRAMCRPKARPGSLEAFLREVRLFLRTLRPL